MKKYILILSLIALFYSTTASADQYWIKQPSPVTVDLWHVSFLDSLNGWIAGDSGLIMKTTNGGLNWTIQDTQTDKLIRKLFVINENLAWAVTWEIFPKPGSFYGTIFMKTTNGGDTWSSEMYPDSNIFINTVHFIDSLKGFIAGYPSVLRTTTDGGKVWIDAGIDSSFVSGFPIFDIDFYNEETGHACGGVIDISGAIFSTYDGGRTWTSATVGPEPTYDLCIFDSLNVIGAGGDFEYGVSTITTSNAGLTWDYRKLGVFGIATAIDFRTRAEGWISLAIAEYMLNTLDSGNNWDTISTPGRVPTYDLIFINEWNGWCVGAEGTILKYNLNKVSINDPELIVPVSYRLLQNYPNPFNPVTVISYQLPVMSDVKLAVYDVTGRLIKILVNEIKEAGTHNITVDGSGLSSGVYFYKLEAGNFIQTKQMILLK